MELKFPGAEEVLKACGLQLFYSSLKFNRLLEHKAIQQISGDPQNTSIYLLTHCAGLRKKDNGNVYLPKIHTNLISV